MNPLVSALKNLSPGKIMKLSGVDEIAAGADLAEEMAVRIEGWSQDGRTLQARASGQLLNLRLADDSPRLIAECGCQDIGERRCCEHIVAALIVFSGLLRNGTISHRPPRDPDYATELLRLLQLAPGSDNTVDPASRNQNATPVAAPGGEVKSIGRRDTLRIVADGNGCATVETAFALILRGGGRWSRIFALQQALRDEEAAGVIAAFKAIQRDFIPMVTAAHGRFPLPSPDQVARGEASIDLDWVGDEIICSPRLRIIEPGQTGTESISPRFAESILLLTPDLAIADESLLVVISHARVWSLGDGDGLGWQSLAGELPAEIRAEAGPQHPRSGRALEPLRPLRFTRSLWQQLCFSLPDFHDSTVRLLIGGQPAETMRQHAVPCIELTTERPSVIQKLPGANARFGLAETTADPAPGPTTGKAGPTLPATVFARLAVDADGARVAAGFDFLIHGLHHDLLVKPIETAWHPELDPAEDPLLMQDVDEDQWYADEDDDDNDEEEEEDERSPQWFAGPIRRALPEFDDQDNVIGGRLVDVRIKPQFAGRVPRWRFASINGLVPPLSSTNLPNHELIRLWWAHLDALAAAAPVDAEQLKLDLPHVPLILTRRAHEADCPLQPLAQPVLTTVEAGQDGRPAWAGVGHFVEAAMLAMRAATPLAPSEISLWKNNFQPYGWWPVSRQRLTDNLQELLALAARHKVRVTLDGQPVERIELDVKLEALEIGDRPDWFELRPEVAWADFKLSDREWIQLLTGGLIRDGKMLIADGESRERLQALDLVLGRGRDGADGRDAAPRLRMFDWLELRRLGVEVAIPESISLLIERLTQPETLEPLPLPAGLKATMRPYQERGYQWLAFLYTQRFGACLADDMGLGKTVQAIALLGGLHEGIIPAPGPDKRPHLIVLPPTLVFNWQTELKRFYPDLKVIEYRGGRQKCKFQPGSVVLTTYDQVRLRIDELAEVGFECLIFDEAQAAKNWSSQRSKAARRLQGRFRLCLTGTPLENHIGEYHSIMELALPGLFGDRRAFLTIVKEDDEKAAMLLNRARPFVMRRTKNLILKELPPKVETEIALPCDPVQREMYTRTVAEVREDIAEAYQLQNQAKAGIKALSALMRLRQICISPALLDPKHTDPSPKLLVLAEKLQELLDESQAALVFSQFTSALDQVEKVLTAESIPYQRLDGSTPKPKRQTLVEAFQDGSGPGVFLISLKTGGAGLNLTRASHVFHLDPWWNPAVEHQATDRAHRIGQTGTVFVHRLLMQHTIEESMMVLKQRKQAVYDRIMAHAAGLATRGTDSETARSALLTREDFEFLLNTTET